MIWWPESRAGEALRALAQAAGLRPKNVEIPPAPAGSVPGHWIESVASSLAVEAEIDQMRYFQVEQRLARAAPALLRTTDGRLLALLKDGVLLAPDLSERRLGRAALREELCRAAEEPLVEEVNAFLHSSGIPFRRQSRVRAALLAGRLGPVRVADCWLLRLPAGASFLLQLRMAGLGRRLAALGGAHIAQYVLWILSWWLVGLGALEGRLDPGWLLAWALVLLTLVPLRALITWLQGLVAITAGGILKERLLCGALRLSLDEVRRQGAGELLGRVIESEALESLALSGGFLALVAATELVVAALVLAVGSGGPWHMLMLAVWAALGAALGRRYYLAESAWTSARLAMTHDLVERMVGHRTRLAQEPRELWHEWEDQQLAAYQDPSRRVDRRAAWMMALVPRGWLLVGLAALAPGFLSGAASPTGLAVGIGGVLLAYRAFRRLASGMWNLVGAAVAWKQVVPLFDAAAREEPPGSPALAFQADEQRVIQAHELTFRYRDRGEPVLRRCNLVIRAGERVLMEGTSGGGKSTLAALLSGLRHPESGLLLAGGVDWQTLGAAGWLRRVAVAPQFHENHILTGTLAYNVLLSRRGCWAQTDFDEAEAVCRELGLAPLLERMPGGMLQMVGESGWQLSHGERSRVYMARALLQGADLLVFDESFAALDPENLRLALHCVFSRAKTLLVIAHP